MTVRAILKSLTACTESPDLTNGRRAGSVEHVGPRLRPKWLRITGESFLPISRSRRLGAMAEVFSPVAK